MQKLVISIDTYVQGKHFLNFKSPDLVIKKILRSSMSDLICKGVYPKHYFISASGNKKNFTKLNLFKVSKSLKEEQKKYNIFLSGGDTVNSNKLSFSITTIGNANNIIFRNKAKIDDDIYVTGNLGDSYIGLKILQKKLFLSKELEKYFVDKYYKPNLQYALVQCWLYLRSGVFRPCFLPSNRGGSCPLPCRRHGELLPLERCLL